MVINGKKDYESSIFCDYHNGVTRTLDGWHYILENI